MRTIRLTALLVLLSMLGLSLLPRKTGSVALAASDSNPPLSQPDDATKNAILGEYGKLALSFEANQGQADRRVKFLSRGQGYTLFLTDDSAVLKLQGETKSTSLKDQDAPETDLAVLRMKLVGANPSTTVVGVDEQSGKSNYLIGNDASKWHTGVVNYSKVRYQNAYPGIDVIYYGNQQQLEYDFVVAPGANPQAILLDVSSDSAGKNSHSVPLRIAGNGDLVVSEQGRELHFGKPAIYQTMAANSADRHAIEGRWVLKGGTKVGFELAAYDETKPLVIDPALAYSTYLGGTAFNAIYGVAVDANGNAYVTGGVTSTDFPLTAGALQKTYAGGHDAFVTKLNKTGNALVYSTFLGGSGVDHGAGIAVDSKGAAYVAGTTSSPNFPVTAGSFQPKCDGCGGSAPDGFVSKLNPTGTGLVYSTYIGGSGYEHIAAMTIDASGNAYVTGFSCSTNYPTTANAFQRTYKGVCNAFGGNVVVSELNATGSALVLSTYLGGTGSDDANSVIVDSAGSIYLAGYTTSTNFPVTSGAFQTTNHGLNDAFVTKFNSAGSALLYSTYIGGSDQDQAWGLKVDANGNAYVVGQTLSANFPVTAGAYQHSCGSCTIAKPQTDAFVTKLTPNGASEIYSTFLGGTGEDVAFAISLGSVGDAFVAGESNSKDFRTTTGAFQASNPGGTEGFVTHFSTSGSSALYSTYVGNGASTILGISANPTNGSFIVAGRTYSTTFPVTPGAFQTACPTCNNALMDSDGFIVRFITGDQIWPLTVNFGNQVVGVLSHPLTTVLTNSTTNPLHVSSIKITGPNAAAFTQSSPTCTSAIAVGASCTISVEFKAAAVGPETATLTVTDDAANNPQTVVLQGTGTTAQVAPASLPFTKQTVGTQSTAKAITVTNKGTATLTISGITITGAFPGDFAQVSNCGSMAAGASCTINVTFKPTAAGPRTAIISITDNGGGSTQTVPLSGTGA
jgi:hypothetical protein